MKKTFLFLIIILLTLAVGCGSGGSQKNPVTVGQKLVDPSGNWKMSFTDTGNNNFLLSSLFAQTGAVVTAVNTSEVGNAAPGFTCVAQRDIGLANGLVANVNQFSGDFSGNFGSIHFATTLNDAGTHAEGTYTITPPQGGNCLGAALTGNLIADEVPSIRQKSPLTFPTISSRL